MELDRRGAELLFQVLTEREEKNAIAIASNQSFSAWTDTFTDPRLCAAIVDRLTYNATIIETGTNSYRLELARLCDSTGHGVAIESSARQRGGRTECRSTSGGFLCHCGYCTGPGHRWSGRGRWVTAGVRGGS